MLPVSGAPVENLGTNVRAAHFLCEVSVLDRVEASTDSYRSGKVPKPLGSRF